MGIPRSSDLQNWNLTQPSQVGPVEYTDCFSEEV